MFAPASLFGSLHLITVAELITYIHKNHWTFIYDFIFYLIFCALKFFDGVLIIPNVH